MLPCPALLGVPVACRVQEACLLDAGLGLYVRGGVAEGRGMRLHKFLVLCCILLGVIYDFDAHLCGNTTNQNENAIANGNPNEQSQGGGGGWWFRASWVK